MRLSIGNALCDLGINAGFLYAVSNSVEKHYHQVSFPKGDGGCWIFSVPAPLLKTIQRRIPQILLVHMPISPRATVYRYGESAYRSVALQAEQPTVLKLDIRHFFDSILHTTVKESTVPAEIYAEPLQILLTMQCYTPSFKSKKSCWNLPDKILHFEGPTSL